ncbi:hypothetical protein PanWU01x14_184140 [Parasponia andersonii]|uniref:Uncharacterized protein n=1 Tax=Parasponia andersonii TaxID=3476 RepID=A0A2P5C4W5_PARAD|nr:hypothetical protein PanWU01x14_184140 [Parasponia andersonii]
MVASREEALTQAQAQAHEIVDPVDPALSAESVVSPIAIDEYAIITQPLGTRSRWQKGVGSLPQLKSVGGPKATSIINVAVVQCDHGDKGLAAGDGEVEDRGNDVILGGVGGGKEGFGQIGNNTNINYEKVALGIVPGYEADLAQGLRACLFRH